MKRRGTHLAMFWLAALVVKRQQMISHLPLRDAVGVFWSWWLPSHSRAPSLECAKAHHGWNTSLYSWCSAHHPAVARIRPAEWWNHTSSSWWCSSSHSTRSPPVDKGRLELHNYYLLYLYFWVVWWIASHLVSRPLPGKQPLSPSSLISWIATVVHQHPYWGCSCLALGKISTAQSKKGHFPICQVRWPGALLSTNWWAHCQPEWVLFLVSSCC